MLRNMLNKVWDVLRDMLNGMEDMPRDMLNEEIWKC